MQHILNIAFDFDDEKVKKIAENALEKDLDNIIRTIILDEIAPYKPNYFEKKGERDWTPIRNKVVDGLDKILYEHKEEIIDIASTKLADSVKRTKVWRERYQEVI